MSSKLSKSLDDFESGINLSNSVIADFYGQRTILITGATGFVGSVILEKLLYCCEDIKNVYVLIRKKKEKALEERFEEMLNSSIFERIRKEKSHMLKKVTPIAGDTSEPQLGIRDEDQDLLCREVSVVLHVAATTNFNTELKYMLTINTRSAQQMLRLCRKMHHLQALVHVSTAYANGHHSVIKEEVYDTHYPLETMWYLGENDTLSENFITKLIGGRPNTYTLTKALAEEVIRDEKGDVPACIVRPSVIISSVKDPVKGWVEGVTGANAVVAGIAQGVLRTWYGQPDMVADLVPVDIAANLTIVAAWDTYNRHIKGDNQVKVFNCCSGLRNPITMKRFLSLSLHFSTVHAFDGVFLFPSLIVTSNRLFHQILFFLLQTVPSFIYDIFSWIRGKKFRMSRVQENLKKLASALEFFTWYDYLFIDENVSSLYKILPAEDQKIFDFNVQNYEWVEYLENYVIGLRTCMKEKMKVKK